jgi:uncharacterized protein (TIGR03437 family)
MRSFRLLCALVLFVSARADLSGSGNAPAYTAASIVNAATEMPGPLAPNTIATVYGTNLSWQTYAVTSADINGGSLPQTVQGVTVFVGGLEASLYYVSPTQINFLVPYELVPGTTKIYVARDGVRGPDAMVQLNYGSPGFFEWSGNLAVAEHADGSVISTDSPASAGEIIVLYAAGLGYTAPGTQTGRIVQQATWITGLANLQVLLDGNPCPAQNILYAGLTPGNAGLYQINLRLPNSLSPNPVIQVAMGSNISPNTVQLPTR